MSKRRIGPGRSRTYSSLFFQYGRLIALFDLSSGDDHAEESLFGEQSESECPGDYAWVVLLADLSDLQNDIITKPYLAAGSKR